MSIRSRGLSAPSPTEDERAANGCVRPRRIVVPATDWRGLDSRLDAHFGRCPYYVCVDVADGKIQGVQVLSNPYHTHHEPRKAPLFVLGFGPQVVLCDGIGAWAISMFDGWGVEVISGAKGTVRYAVSLYLGGQLRGRTPCPDENPEAHF